MLSGRSQRVLKMTIKEIVDKKVGRMFDADCQIRPIGCKVKCNRVDHAGTGVKRYNRNQSNMRNDRKCRYEDGHQKKLLSFLWSSRSPVCVQISDCRKLSLTVSGEFLEIVYQYSAGDHFNQQS